MDAESREADLLPQSLGQDAYHPMECTLRELQTSTSAYYGLDLSHPAGRAPPLGLCAETKVGRPTNTQSGGNKHLESEADQDGANSRRLHPGKEIQKICSGLAP